MNILRLFFTSFLVCIASINTHRLYAMDQQDDSIPMDLVDPSELQDSSSAPTNTSAVEAEIQDSSSTNTTLVGTTSSAPLVSTSSTTSTNPQDDALTDADYTPYNDPEPTSGSLSTLTSDLANTSIPQNSLSSSATTSSSSSSSNTNNINTTNSMSLAQFNEKKKLIETCWILVGLAMIEHPDTNHFSVTDVDKETKKAIYLVASYKECFDKEANGYFRELYKTTREQTPNFEKLMAYAREVIKFYDIYYGYKWFTIADDGSLINNYKKHILQDISESAYLKRKQIAANEKNKRDGTTSSGHHAGITL